MHADAARIRDSRARRASARGRPSGSRAARRGAASVAVFAVSRITLPVLGGISGCTRTTANAGEAGAACHGDPGSSSGGSVRATTQHSTRAAPARRSVRAASASVAPVVITSSTSAMRAPRTAARTANAPRTLRRRSAHGSAACGGPAEMRASGAASGSPVPRGDADRDLARLVEAALALARRGERQRDDAIRASVPVRPASAPHTAAASARRPSRRARSGRRT